MFGRLTQPILIILGLVFLGLNLSIGVEWYVLAINVAIIIAAIVEPRMPWGHRS